MTGESRFEALVSGLDYPMFIVTAAAGDRRAGCLVGFATQCSINPPRFLVCLSKTNETHQVAAEADTLAVHVPRARDRSLAELFGGETGHETDKFAQVNWHPGPNGVPILDDCPQWFAGRIVSRQDTGDHEAIVLAPVDASATHANPQLPFQEVRDLPPGNAP